MLKPGTVEALYNNTKDSPLYDTPVVQLLSLKKIEGKSDKTVRYHITISDGKLYMKGIFSSQVSKEVGDIKVNTIIKISDFVILEKNGNCFIYIKGCEKIRDCERVGSPKNASSTEKVDSSVEMDSSKIKQSEKNTAKRAPDENNNKRVQVGDNNGKTAKESVTGTNNSTDDEKKAYTPIAALNPFQTKWIVKGTVQKKSEMREFKKKDGKFFSFELLDKTGNIKCVAFNDGADLFYGMIVEGSVVEISKAVVKMCNKKFANTSSDYEIHLEKNSVVSLLNEEGLSMSYDLCKISNLAGRVNKANCDVIGIVHEAFPVSVVLAKASQREIKKRDLVLADETGTVRATLWGDKSEIELDDHPVLLLKDVRVGEFNNAVVLSTAFGSAVKVDPEMDEAYALRGWYDEHKQSVVVERPQRNDYAFIEEIQGYGTCSATVLFIREDNLFYNACANNCNKKVSLTDEGYYCERCNQTREICNIRYLTTLHVADFTQQVWLNVFDDFCTEFFGMTAVELKKMGEENATQLQNYLKTLLYREYVIKMKRSEEVYNGEMRVRWRGLSIKKINYLDESVRMLRLMGY
ncbi:Single-stranded DNA-binding replication protein A [Trachipleistophora hominis]|uniref:Replication protein A subunit n=1 Tax=Trachipleistophora hominis TaxID=72359 RepID=L7JTC3_TRAHO|nr:Single-stranded DNA-binding replication protein A [Trachipleistophora hominis]